MVYVKRLLPIFEILQKKSAFLFGPRQTGKSTIIDNEFKGCPVYDLLEADTFIRLSRDPSRIRQELTEPGQIVVIDEIQKLPVLLDEVHLLIEKQKHRFLLTGSSARKLRLGGVDLLGGRARSRTLHPFVTTELKDIKLESVLKWGLMPSIYFSDTPDEDLKDYCGEYLQLEIAAEGLTRNLPAFSRFLEVAALSQCRLINYTEISNDSQVKLTTVREYFQILKDTLIAQELPAYQMTRKRKAIQTSKFYFFDVGVVRKLQGRSDLAKKTPEFGEAFETFIFHELQSYTDYRQKQPLTYWRSTSGFEVDFILDEKIAIEVKSKENVSFRDLRSLKALREEKLLKKYLVVSLEKKPRLVDDIEILPWKVACERLWADAL